jgi:glutamate 5-kinase
MVITTGKRLNPVHAIGQGARATWFAPSGNPVTARKKWISGQLQAAGSVTVDEGALKALFSGKSLLPAGVRRVEGRFSRGDVVVVRGPDGVEAARGIIAYDFEDAARIAGCKSDRIAEILGFAGRSEMIHRDDLVVKSVSGKPVGEASQKAENDV